MTRRPSRSRGWLASGVLALLALTMLAAVADDSPTVYLQGERVDARMVRVESGVVYLPASLLADRLGIDIRVNPVSRRVYVEGKMTTAQALAGDTGWVPLPDICQAAGATAVFRAQEQVWEVSRAVTPRPTYTTHPTPRPSIAPTPVQTPVSDPRTPAPNVEPEGSETDTEGIITDHYWLTVSGHDVAVDVLRPSVTGPVPAILHLPGKEDQDLGRAAFKVRLLAQAGYLVFIPNYTRTQSVAYQEASTCLRALRALAHADKHRIAITGASMGGRLALQIASRDHDLRAIAVLAPAITPEVFDEVRTLSCPVMINHGDADTTVPVELSDQLRAQLMTQGTPVEMITWPGLDHGFNNKWSMVYQKVLEYLSQKL